MPQFAFFLEPVRPEMPDDPTPEESAAVAEHFLYLSRLTREGTVALAGRTLEAPHRGLVILEAATLDDAQALLEADPGIRAGAFRGQAAPFRVALLNAAPLERAVAEAKRGAS